MMAGNAHCNPDVFASRVFESPSQPEECLERGTTQKDDQHLAMGRNQWYHFGVGAPPILVYLVGIGTGMFSVRDIDPWPSGKPKHAHSSGDLVQ